VKRPTLTLERLDVTGNQFAKSGGRARERRHLWAAVAIGLVTLGTLGSVMTTGSIAHNSEQQSQESFNKSSAEIASILTLSIQHEQDLVIAASGFINSEPHASESEFVQWANSVRALKRYPELIGFGESVIVPRQQLAAFVTHVVATSTVPLGPDGTFQVVPPGNRPFYCLSVVKQVRSASDGITAGKDYCIGAQGRARLASRDSGLGAYVPVTFGRSTYLQIESPIYRGASVPRTVNSRRGAFIGWVGMSIVPKVLLGVALDDHPGTAVSLRFDGGRHNVAFSDGRVPRNSQHLTVNLHNGWTVETSSYLSRDGLVANDGALVVLSAGIILSILIGLLAFLLGTGRSRALALVDQRTEELRHQALHDDLTGLPNRLLLLDRIDQLLASTRRRGSTPALMYVDLDQFKNVNDTLGHSAGDQLLLAVGARLMSALREVDTIGRMSGDEFVVLIDCGDHDGSFQGVAQRLLAALAQPFELGSGIASLRVTASVGIATGDRGSADELLRDADVAMYLAKKAGRNCYEVFRPEMDTEIRRHNELEFAARRALDEDQFRLVYQPIYNLEDLSLVGVEALLRWDHPTFGLVRPDEFIPLLESSDQIVEVGRWVLTKACLQMTEWGMERGNLGLSVNVSGRQLDQDVLVGHVREALRNSGLDPARLTLEVTETALMREAETAQRRLTELKEIGVKLAIDDFGTGYSSLAYLQKFPFDCLKIDRTFTNGISDSTESRAMIRTLVQLGRALGLKTVAEGVESTEQVDCLRREQVDEAQGFLMARPLDPDTFASTILAPFLQIAALE
jgi:diguanylate cyclase (GGDEF)-like protein